MKTKMMRAGCLAAAAALLVTACGKRDEKKDKGTGASPGTQGAQTADDPRKDGPATAADGKARGDFVFNLAAINSAGVSGTLALELSPDSAAAIATNVEVENGQVILRDVPVGSYRLSLDDSQGLLSHAGVVEVEAGATVESQSEDALRAKACEGLEQAKTMPRFTNLIAASAAAAPLAQGTKLHVVSAYEAMGRDCPNASRETQVDDEAFEGNRYGIIRVKVEEADVALHLSSYEPALWWIDVKEGASVKSISMSGYYPSRLVGVPAGITEVRTAFYPEAETITSYIQNLDEEYMPAYDEATQSWGCSDEIRTIKDGDYAADMAFIKRLSGGAEVSSVQTLYQGATFLVNGLTRGELTTKTREAGKCYRGADGKITIQM